VVGDIGNSITNVDSVSVWFATLSISLLADGVTIGWQPNNPMPTTITRIMKSQ
jgi:hypothetical protein